MIVLPILRRGTCAALALAATLALPAWAQSRPDRLLHPFAASQPVPGRYIVLFQRHVTNPAALAAQLAHGGRLHHVYGNALRGFAATLPPAAVQALANHPDVASIEQDQTVSLQAAGTQDQTTWGLDRIDQIDLPLDTQYRYTQSGTGVTAFIVDTGLRADHSEFAGRVLGGYTSIADGQDTNDCNGHGTHVAGTVGGSTWGVAKSVQLVPVRVLDCTGAGTWSGVIAGVDWVAGSTQRPAVANMSLGGGASSSVDAAVEGAIAKGVTFAVAAGNSSANACLSSPARTPSAITVGATTSSDARASYSNWGTCLDLFAPGSSITSAWNTGTNASNTISGTSMATPHVTGAAALVLEANPGASPAAVAAALVRAATASHVTSAGTGSPNRLLNTQSTSLAAPEPAPIAVSFKSMAGTAQKLNTSSWRASVLVSVRTYVNGTSNAVANATVTGSFSPGGNVSCVTGSTGTCTVNSPTFKTTSTRSTTFTGTGISGSLMVYEPSQNSQGATTVNAP